MGEVIRTMKDFVSTTIHLSKFAVWKRQKKSRERQFSSIEAETLDEHGVVVVPDFLDEETCDRYKAEIEELVDNREKYEGEDDVVVARGEEIAAVDGEGKTVVHIREGHDGKEAYDTGMIDVRNIDEFIPELTDFTTHDTILDIVKEASGHEFTHQLRAYVNRSVTNTRGYHADVTSKVPNYKAFIYLTDVPHDSYGPYSYVPGSHHAVLRRLVNEFYNTVNGYPDSDMRLFFESDAQNMTASKGTLIVSNQNGVHRGIPQEEGKERFVLVNTYFPDESE